MEEIKPYPWTAACILEQPETPMAREDIQALLAEALADRAIQIGSVTGKNQLLAAFGVDGTDEQNASEYAAEILIDLLGGPDDARQNLVSVSIVPAGFMRNVLSAVDVVTGNQVVRLPEPRKSAVDRPGLATVHKLPRQRCK